MNINEIPKMPDDWGANERERLLSFVNQSCDDFLNDSSFINKERLIAITTFDEPTRHHDFGVIRFTEYESYLFNILYVKFKTINFQYGISFLYDLLWQGTMTLKMYNMMPINKIELGECYKGIRLEFLYFFYSAYSYLNEKKRFFADELINNISLIETTSNLSTSEINTIYLNVIFDLSLKSNNHWFKEFDFSRDEIRKLLKKSADLMKKSNLNQTERPHLGMLCMIISNFILRSRNDYKFNNIYKCINRDVVEKSFENCELWMKRKSKLNDKREGAVYKEIFSDRRWISYSWARNFKITFERETFTCSFSTELPGKKLQKKYGEFIYGYHNDIVGASITTLIEKVNTETKHKIGSFSQFIVYDMLYSRDEFKQEILYLMSIIDDFKISAKDKKYFLEQIIDYWKLTIKDKKWEDEHERRYEIMHYSDYGYRELTLDETYLKNKTCLLLYPDFIIGQNPMRESIKANIIEKANYKNLSCSSIMCKTCLFESTFIGHDQACPVCGSKEFEEINKRD